MPRVNPGPPCKICGKESIARELCGTHYKRWQRHGHTMRTRPDDWGKREKHPLWNSWAWMQRSPQGNNWTDFWDFVEDVGDRPEENRILRYDTKLPWGPNNFYWKKQTAGSENRNAYARDFRKRNPLKVKNSQLKARYGIGIEEYDLMLHEQGGGCAICGKEDDHFSLAVDHDHDTKSVRGLLCSQCNRGLGLFRDSPELLKKALQYLHIPQ